MRVQWRRASRAAMRQKVTACTSVGACGRGKRERVGIESGARCPPRFAFALAAVDAADRVGEEEACSGQRRTSASPRRDSPARDLGRDAAKAAQLGLLGHAIQSPRPRPLGPRPRRLGPGRTPCRRGHRTGGPPAHFRAALRWRSVPLYSTRRSTTCRCCPIAAPAGRGRVRTSPSGTARRNSGRTASPPARRGQSRFGAVRPINRIQPRPERYAGVTIPELADSRCAKRRQLRAAPLLRQHLALYELLIIVVLGRRKRHPPRGASR